MAFTFNRLSSIFDPRKFQQMGQQGGFAPPPDISGYTILPPRPKPKTPADYARELQEKGVFGSEGPYTYDAPPAKIPFPKSPQSKYVGPYNAPPKPMRSSEDLDLEELEDYPEAIEGDLGDTEEEPVTSPTTGRPLITNKPNSTISSSWTRYRRPDVYQREENKPGVAGDVGRFKTEEEHINNILKDYHPETEMSDRVNQLLASFPERQTDFSKWRKFGSFLVGAGLGPEAQEKATYGPYYRKLADWKAQIDPALKGAELEKQSNINLRQLAYQQRQSEIAQQRADATTRDAATREQRMIDQAEAARANIEIRRLIALGGTPFDDPGTNTVWMLYKDGSKKDLQIPSRLVTPAQRQEWELEQIRVAGQERRQTNAADPSGRFERFQSYPPGGGPPIWMEHDNETGASWPLGQRPAQLRGIGTTAPTTGGQPSGQGPMKFSVSEDIPVPGGMGGTSAPPTQQPSQQPNMQAPPDQGSLMYGRPRAAGQDEDDMRARAREIISRDDRFRKIIKFDRGVPYVKEPGRFSGITPEEKKAAVDYIFGTIAQGQGFRPSQGQPGQQGAGQERTTSRGTRYQVID